MPTAPVATKKNVNEVPEEFLDCRDIGHSWAPRTTVENKKHRSYTRVLICNRCSTERIQVISVTGIVLGYSYHYPHGYLLKGVGIMTVDDRARMRLRNLRRML